MTHDVPAYGLWMVARPTLITGLMLPVLPWMYWRLARREEREVLAAFGERYRDCARRVPAFFPQLSAP